MPDSDSGEERATDTSQDYTCILLMPLFHILLLFEILNTIIQPSEREVVHSQSFVLCHMRFINNNAHLCHNEPARARPLIFINYGLSYYARTCAWRNLEYTDYFLRNIPRYAS